MSRSKQCRLCPQDERSNANFDRCVPGRRVPRMATLMGPAFALSAVALASTPASAGAFTVRLSSTSQGPATGAATAPAPSPDVDPASQAAPEAAPEAAPGPAADPAAAPAPDPAPDSVSAPAPAPAPEADPAPEAAAPAPEVVPDEDDPAYASSKDAGTALSGSDVDDRKTTVGTVGDVKEKKEKKGLSHAKTGIIGLGFTYGVSLITAGDKFCGEFSDSRQDPDSRKPLCVGATPPALDILAGFGASDRIDLIVNVRINLMPRDFNTKDCPNPEDDVCNEGKGLFNDKLAIGIMPGVRIYGKDTNRIVKFGGQAQIMYAYEDFSGYRGRPSGPSEDDDPDNREDEDGVGDHFVGLRGGPILQIDPHHNFGITIAPSMIPGFRPKAKSEVDAGWFEIGFEATLGLEARFP